MRSTQIDVISAFGPGLVIGPATVVSNIGKSFYDLGRMVKNLEFVYNIFAEVSVDDDDINVSATLQRNFSEAVRDLTNHVTFIAIGILRTFAAASFVAWAINSYRINANLESATAAMKANDPNAALGFYKTAAEMGDATACFKLGYLYFSDLPLNDLNRQQRDDLALELFKGLADGGNAPACLYTGVLLHVKDAEKAKEYFKKEQELTGKAPGERPLTLDDAEKALVDGKEALRFFQNANLTQPDDNLKFQIANIYLSNLPLEGLTKPQRDERALTILIELADKNHARANALVIALTEQKFPEQAKQYIEKRNLFCDELHDLADPVKIHSAAWVEYSIALILFRGNRQVPLNREEGLKHLEIAVKAGLPEAILLRKMQIENVEQPGEADDPLISPSDDRGAHLQVLPEDNLRGDRPPSPRKDQDSPLFRNALNIVPEELYNTELTNHHRMGSDFVNLVNSKIFADANQMYNQNNDESLNSRFGYEI